MNLLLPNGPNPVATVTLPTPKRKSRALRRLALAIDEMNRNFDVQRREVKAFQQNMQALHEALLETRDSMRSHHDALGQINVTRLGRKARRLAAILEDFEAQQTGAD